MITPGEVLNQPYDLDGILGQKSLSTLMKEAGRIRYQELGTKISYSKNVFVPVSRLCRNRCTYCSFRREPSELTKPLLDKSKVLQLVDEGKKLGCKEVLITLGENPESHKEARLWLIHHGYANISEYLYDLCSMTLKRGLLPHVNAGLLSEEEIRALKEVSASMGLMLETSSNRLYEDSKGPHKDSPGKNPQKRIEMIKKAGENKVPFTTGILVGIGETLREDLESILAIRQIHEHLGHIQEVLIQNFQPKRGTPMEKTPPPTLERMLRVVSGAKVLLAGLNPPIPIQVPPNLNKGREMEFLRAGISDFGGISPLTRDQINPGLPWPDVSYLDNICREEGFQLQERLPTYEGFLSPEWLSPMVLQVIDKFTMSKTHPV